VRRDDAAAAHLTAALGGIAAAVGCTIDVRESVTVPAYVLHIRPAADATGSDAVAWQHLDVLLDKAVWASGGGEAICLSWPALRDGGALDPPHGAGPAAKRGAMRSFLDAMLADAPPPVGVRHVVEAWARARAAVSQCA
jgi:hypothetical protein